MKIKSILVSQPAPVNPDKSPYYEIFTKHKADITYIPFIRVEGLSLKEYRSQRTEILDHTAVIFTSRTTVDHFFRICEEARITVPETMKYICNAEPTALYLQKYIVYRKRKISYAEGNFTSFLELILKNKDEKLLLVLSEPYKAELPETLEKLKVRFNKIVLSRTVSSDLEEVELGKYDLLVFFSPSEISALTSAFGNQNLPMIATFGEGTAVAAANAGLTVNVMAPTPEAPSMAKAIEIFMKRVNAGESVAPVEIKQSKEAEAFIKAQESKPQKKAKPRKSSSTCSRPAQRSAGEKATANSGAKATAANATAKKATTPKSPNVNKA